VRDITAKKKGSALAANPLIFVAGTTRLELATSGVTGRMPELHNLLKYL
jgi:hypothetical protein